MASMVFDSPESRHHPRFILLGKAAQATDPLRVKRIVHKTITTKRPPTGSAWATLGWKDDRPFEPRGTIYFSRDANTDSKSVTLEQIKHIRNFNPMARGRFKVRERYINFDHVDFGFDPAEFRAEDLPELRMTLFVEPDEGAVVYYQYSDRGDYDDPEAGIEYILPGSTGPDHHSDRRHLDYHFPILPSKEPAPVPDRPGMVRTLKQKSSTSFIIKVLTFRRHSLKADDLLHEGLNTLLQNTGDYRGHPEKPGYENYDLLRFDPEANAFRSTATGARVDYGLKTLLLLHGMFVQTSESFGELYGAGPGGTYLRDLMVDGAYGQILAFDHATVIHDALTNCSHLYGYLAGGHFTYPVDLMGTSRGAVLAYALASDARNVYFTCGKVLSVSGGFGIGYLAAGRTVSKFLKVMVRLLPGTGRMVALLAQFSVDFFLKQPGVRQITPDSQRLLAVVDAFPVSTLTVYRCIVADWDKKLKPPGMKRLPFVLLDALIKMLLGTEHDWVVGTRQQSISPAAFSRPPIAVVGIHGKLFEPGFPKPAVRPLVRGFLDGGEGQELA